MRRQALCAPPAGVYKPRGAVAPSHLAAPPSVALLRPQCLSHIPQPSACPRTRSAAAGRGRVDPLEIPLARASRQGEPLTPPVPRLDTLLCIPFLLASHIYMCGALTITLREALLFLSPILYVFILQCNTFTIIIHRYDPPQPGAAGCIRRSRRHPIQARHAP